MVLLLMLVYILQSVARYVALHVPLYPKFTDHGGGTFGQVRKVDSGYNYRSDKVFDHIKGANTSYIPLGGLLSSIMDANNGKHYTRQSQRWGGTD